MNLPRRPASYSVQLNTSCCWIQKIWLKYVTVLNHGVSNALSRSTKRAQYTASACEKTQRGNTQCCAMAAAVSFRRGRSAKNRSFSLANRFETAATSRSCASRSRSSESTNAASRSRSFLRRVASAPALEPFPSPPR